MTASQIARQLHGVKAGKRWSCRCPNGRMHQHGDRNRSLSVWESEDGWVCLKCFAGCSRDDMLSAMGLQVRDLALNGFTRSPEWEQRKRDEDRLEKQEHRLGLAMMAQAVIPEERRYWSAVERNIAVEIRQLRSRLFPDEAANNLRNETAQHLIAEYGDDIWECIP
jgi:hypothetical protein